MGVRRIAGVEVRYPDLPDPASLIPTFPTVAAGRDYFEQALGAVGGSGLIAGRVDSIATAAASVASSAIGPISAALGIGAVAMPGIGSAIGLAAPLLGGLFKGIFGGDPPPPPPQIGGEEADTVIGRPFASIETALVAGKVQSGAIESNVQTEATGRSRSALRGVLEDLERDVSFGDENRALRGNRDRGIAGMRAVCFYVACADYDLLFDELVDNAPAATRPKRAEILGRLLQWGAPRVLFRDLLGSYACYRFALIGVYASRFNPNATSQSATMHHGEGPWEEIPGVDGGGRGSGLWTQPIPYLTTFRPRWGSDGADDPWSRKFAQAEDKGGFGPTTAWLQRLLAYALPLPDQPSSQQDTAPWFWAPIPPEIADSELRWYQRYIGTGNFRYYVGGNTTATFKFMGDPREWTNFGSNQQRLPESFAQAYANAMAILASRTQAAVDWRGEAQERVTTMKERRRPSTAGIRKSLARMREIEAETVAKRKMVKTLLPVLAMAKAKAQAKVQVETAARRRKTALVAAGVGAAAIGGYALLRRRA